MRILPTPHDLLTLRLRWQHLCHHWLWPRSRLAPVTGMRHFLLLVGSVMALLAWWFAFIGHPIPQSRWKAVDILSEGLMVLLCLVWLMQVRVSRPAGPVTDGMCWGLGLLAWGNTADWLDEFWKLPREAWFLGAVEPVANVAGVLVLSWALHHWRHEQARLSLTLGQRERGRRDLFHSDRVTALGDLRLLMDSMDAPSGCWVRVQWHGLTAPDSPAGQADAEAIWSRGIQGWMALLPHDALLVSVSPGCLVCWLPSLDEASAARQAGHAMAWWTLLLEAQGRTARSGEIDTGLHAIRPGSPIMGQFLMWQRTWWSASP